MTTSAFLDLYLRDHEEVATNDNNYTTLRAVLMDLTQQALQEIWDSDDWDFKRTVGDTLSLTSGNYKVAAPTGFHQMGHNGYVGVQNEAYEIVKRDPWVVHAERRSHGSATGKPTMYAIDGQDSTTLRPQLVFDYVANQTYTLELDYERVCPTLVDQTDTTNKLDNLPNEHALGVLLPAVVELRKSMIADGRVPGELGPRAKAAIARMKAHRVADRPDEGRLGDYGVRLYGMH